MRVLPIEQSTVLTRFCWKVLLSVILRFFSSIEIKMKEVFLEQNGVLQFQETIYLELKGLWSVISMAKAV